MQRRSQHATLITALPSDTLQNGWKKELNQSLASCIIIPGQLSPSGNSQFVTTQLVSENGEDSLLFAGIQTFCSQFRENCHLFSCYCSRFSHAWLSQCSGFSGFLCISRMQFFFFFLLIFLSLLFLKPMLSEHLFLQSEYLYGGSVLKVPCSYWRCIYQNSMLMFSEPLKRPNK